MRWVDVALVFLVFVAAAADLTPDVNEAHYLTKARHYWDPAFGAGDFFLESRDAHIVFYWLAGWLTMALPLSVAAWIGRIVTWILLAWAWVRLCHAVSPRLGTPVLAAALWAIGVQVFDLAGEWVVGGFEAKPLAYVLVFLGLEALVRRRWNRVWILLGTASAIHVLVGGWSAILAACVWLRDPRRPGPMRVLPAMSVGFAVALLGLVPAALINQGTTADLVDRASQIYVYERLPHHLSPASLSPSDQVERYARHAIVVLVFAALGFFGRCGARHRRLRTWICSAAAIAGVGLVLSFASPLAPGPAARLLRFYWFRLNDMAMPLGVALFATRALAAMRIRQSRAGMVLAVTTSLVAATYLGLGFGARLRAPGSSSDGAMQSAARWRHICEWIMEHTPTGSRFLTPLEAQTFVWRTGRAQVVTMKDVPQDAAGIVEWRFRIQDIWEDDGGTRYESAAAMAPARLRELGGRYGAQFLVTTALPVPDLPLLYSNDTYAVYALAPRAPPLTQ